MTDQNLEKLRGPNLRTLLKRREESLRRAAKIGTRPRRLTDKTYQGASNSHLDERSRAGESEKIAHDA